ncbi:MAG: Zn-ribbon domain-containing OB-fold protein [Candidatus Bathyarchaeota archaeon]|jgi:uncharacterized OB-fold protein
MEKPLTLKSSRKLEIRYNLPISKTSRFWNGLKEGKVYATKCQKCGRLNFPPVADCGSCGSSKANWIELNGEGEIITFTEVHVKPASFCNESNYIITIAKLKEGVNVLAWLTGIKREKVKVGMKVKLVTKVFPDKRIAYEFIPCD